MNDPQAWHLATTARDELHDLQQGGQGTQCGNSHAAHIDNMCTSMN